MGWEFEDEFEDPQLDARWEKLNAMVEGMKRRGERGVEVGKEEVRVRGRVLGVDEMGDADADGAGKEGGAEVGDLSFSMTEIGEGEDVDESAGQEMSDGER